jgi:hypothetical protein
LRSVVAMDVAESFGQRVDLTARLREILVRCADASSGCASGSGPRLWCRVARKQQRLFRAAFTRRCTRAQRPPLSRPRRSRSYPEGTTVLRELLQNAVRFGGARRCHHAPYAFMRETETQRATRLCCAHHTR